MLSKSEIYSVINTLRIFKPLFPLKTIVKDLFFFPVEYYIQAGKARVLPTNIDLIVTHRCNLSCKVCFDHYGRKTFRQDLPLKLIQTLIGSFPEKYRPAIFLGGGEPFIREDIMAVIECIKAKNLKVGLSTNGLLITKSMLRDLKKIPLDVIMFSFHGPQDVHERIVGFKNTFEQTLANIEMFQRECRDSKVIFNYIINEFNFSVEKIEEFIRQCIAKKVSVKNIRLVHLNFVTNEEQQKQRNFWKENMHNREEPIYNIYNKEIEDFFVDRDIINNILSYIRKQKRTYSFSFKPYLTRDEMLSWYSFSGNRTGRRCLLPWRSLFINVDGNVYACQNMHFPVGSIKENTIGEIFNDDRLITLRKQLKKGLFPICLRCCKL